eukprot:TRINITY_DN5965_c0_g1_i1.p1 TRINITY_DN5965_c0_g1~~TRINITY_DN5965_c0_g1_i1.p1  ORF type:complete len:670 (-),score=180.17 TRINITY_DN5965_c0_g1_i1:85-2094(-)
MSFSCNAAQSMWHYLFNAKDEQNSKHIHQWNIIELPIVVIEEVLTRLHTTFINQSPPRTNIVLAFQNFLDIMPKPTSQVLDQTGRRNYELVKLIVNKFLRDVTRDRIEDVIKIVESIKERYMMLMIRDSNLKYLADNLDNYLCTGILLGQGGFGKVFIGYDRRTALKVAIKVIDTEKITDQKLKKKLDDERALMRTLSHTNIAALIHDYSDLDSLYLVMELCSEGTLEDYLKGNKNIPEVQVKNFVQQTARALQYLRQKGIIHRDLKPANILITKDANGALVLKLTDFTFARVLEENDLAQTRCGTPLYMAPEIALASNYTDKSDLWSVGVITYELFVGQRPFSGSSLQELFVNVKNKPVVIPQHLHPSHDLSTLVGSLLKTDPNDRLSWNEFFAHSFISLPEPPDSAKKSTDDVSARLEMESLRKRIEELVEREEKMKKQLAEKEAAMRNGEKEIGEMMVWKATCEMEAKEANERMNKLERSVAIRDRELLAKNRELSEKAREAEERERKIAELSRSSLNDKELKDARDKISNLEKAQSTRDRELDAKSREMSQRDAELKEKTRELNEKAQAVDEKEKQILELTSKIVKRQQEYDNLNSVFEDAMNVNRTLETRVSHKKERIKQLRSSLRAAESDREHILKENESYRMLYLEAEERMRQTNDFHRKPR